ncbi:hypothetical protein, partial [Proteus vulgaris]|uniref:hypothetical protein n=1 Tax=Proteus vulgaris TaxID=585 RepID=UPI0019543828
FIIVYHEKPVPMTVSEIPREELILTEEPILHIAEEKRNPSGIKHIKDILGHIPMTTRYIGGRDIHTIPVKTHTNTPPDEFKIATEKQLEALHT